MHFGDSRALRAHATRASLGAAVRRCVGVLHFLLMSMQPRAAWRCCVSLNTLSLWQRRATLALKRSTSPCRSSASGEHVGGGDLPVGPSVGGAPVPAAPRTAPGVALAWWPSAAAAFARRASRHRRAADRRRTCRTRRSGRRRRACASCVRTPPPQLLPKGPDQCVDPRFRVRELVVGKCIIVVVTREFVGSAAQLVCCADEFVELAFIF